MKAVLFQQNIVWGSPEDNRRKLDAALAAMPKADLYILPEMFSTGFITGRSDLAEQSPAPTLEWMKASSAELDAAIAGSVAVSENGRCYNRMYFVKPGGEVSSYDKRHLFAYGGENGTFSPGDRRVIVEWRGVRLLLLVCYDLRFPVWARNRNDYDGIILSANWPDVRRHAWDTLIQARAIENQCYMAAVNRCGSDPACNYSGGTVFVNPFGEIIADCTDYTEEYITGEYDMAALESFRKRFPVCSDADDFELV